MASNNNGFADALKQINTLVDVNEKVALDALEEAANYFAKKLRLKIPVGVGIDHLRDNLKVVVKKDMVQVVFEGNSFYWHLVEHGHRKAGGRGKVKGRHFVQNTFDAESDKIGQIMTNKIIKKMEG